MKKIHSQVTKSLNSFNNFHLNCVLLALLISIFMLSGCAGTITPKKIEGNPVINFEANKAYVIINQKLADGPVQRFGLSVFSNGKYLDTKGVVLKSSELNTFTKLPVAAIYNEIKVISSVNEDAYTVWEIPEKQLAESGAYILTFLRNVEWLNSDGKWCRVFGMALPNFSGYSVSPYECMSGIESIDEKYIIFMKGAGLDPFTFKKMKKKKSPEQFYGAAFFINKPGIYYLGDIQMSASLLENIKKEKESCTLNTELSKNTRELNTYLKHMGYHASFVYDLTSSWQKIFIREYPMYFDDPLKMEGVNFIRATPSNLLLVN